MRRKMDEYLSLQEQQLCRKYGTTDILKVLDIQYQLIKKYESHPEKYTKQ